MKLFITLILFTGFNLALAAETPNDPAAVDHSIIFQHAQNQKEAPDLENMLKAEVVSVLNTKGYTYIEVTKDDKPVWLAVPTTEVEAGDSIHYKDGPLIYNYHSQTLERSFESVIFLLNVVVNSDE